MKFKNHIASPNKTIWVDKEEKLYNKEVEKLILRVMEVG